MPFPAHSHVMLHIIDHCDDVAIYMRCQNKSVIYHSGILYNITEGETGAYGTERQHKLHSTAQHTRHGE